MRRNLIGFILISLLSCCSKNEDASSLTQETSKAKGNELHGKILSRGSVVAELKLTDCYCKKFKDRVVIFHRQYGLNFDSGQNRILMILVMEDSIDFIFLNLGFGEPIKYFFEEKKLILNSPKQSIGQILKGNILLRGSGLDSDGNELNLELMGNFECVVKDRSYKHDSQSPFKTR